MTLSIVEDGLPVEPWVGRITGSTEAVVFERTSGELFTADPNMSTSVAGLSERDIERGRIANVTRVRLGPHPLAFTLTLPSAQPTIPFEVAVNLNFHVTSPIQVVRRVRSGAVPGLAVRQDFEARAVAITSRHPSAAIEHVRTALEVMAKQSTPIADFGITSGPGRVTVTLTGARAEDEARVRHQLAMAELEQQLELKKIAFYRDLLANGEEIVLPLLLARQPEQIAETLDRYRPTLRKGPATPEVDPWTRALVTIFSNLEPHEKQQLRRDVIRLLARSERASDLEALREALDDDPAPTATGG